MSIKRLMTLLLALSLCFTLSAETLDKIISSAKENSPSYKNATINYENGLLKLQQQDIEDKTLITVSGTVKPVYENMSGNNSFSINPSVSVTTADKKTTINGTLGYDMDYKNTTRTITPGVSASHTFDFSGYDSTTLEDLNYSTMKIQTEMSYAKTEYSFEKTVISTISSLTSSLKSMASVEKQIADLETQISNIDELGSIDKSSVSYKNLVNSLTTLKNTKASLDKQYENAKENYKAFTGLVWDGVDALTEPDLSLNVLTSGNSTVMLASLNVQIAEEDYQALYSRENPKSLTVNGNTSGSYTSSTNDSGMYSIGAGLSYSANNWSVGAEHSSSWTFTSDKTKYSPSLTIKGTWTNGSIGSGSADATAKELQLKTKENAIIEANNNYVAALTDYTQEAQSLNLRIMEWNFKKTQTESDMKYLEDVLKNKKELFSMGLVPQKDVDDAQFDVEQAQYDYTVRLLEGLSLERDLNIFAL